MSQRQRPWVSWALLLLLAVSAGCDGGGVTVGTGGQDEDDALPSGDGPDETPLDPVAATLAPVAILFELDSAAALEKNENAGGNGNGGQGSENAADEWALHLCGAWLRITEISLPTSQFYDCGQVGAGQIGQLPTCLEDRVEFNGDWELDLLTGEFDPVVAAWLLPATTYSELQFSLDRATAENVSLFGWVSKADGDDDGDDEEDLHFAIEVSIPGKVEASRSQPIVIEAEGGVIDVVVDRDVWFSDIAPAIVACSQSSKAVYSEDGVLLIGENSQGPCNQVRGAIRSNFVAAVKLR